MAPKSTLAVVIPIFNEQAALPQLFQRMRTVCNSMEDVDWRVIFVNDGRDDESAAMILAERAIEPRFSLVDLSRNFGHQPAISAGLAHADADAVVIIDGDLQDPPEVIPSLVAAWRAGGQVILPIRRSRQERGLRRIGFDVFHALFSWISD